MKRRSIRGCDRDRVTLVRAPDPLDVALGHKPVDMLHLTAAKGDGYSGACSWTVLLTLTGARRLHAALGELLAAPKRRRRRQR